MNDPESLPTDPFASDELRRRFRRSDVESQLRTLAWSFAAVHGVLVATFVLTSVFGWSVGALGGLLFTAVPFLLSLVVAATMAVIALRNAAVVRRRWLAGGLTPWLLLVAEVTVALLGLAVF